MHAEVISFELIFAGAFEVCLSRVLALSTQLYEILGCDVEKYMQLLLSNGN